MSYVNRGIFIFLLLFINILLHSNNYTISGSLESQADVSLIKNKQNNIKVVYMPPASEYKYYRSIGRGIKDYANLNSVKYEILAPLIDNPNKQLELLTKVVNKNEVDIIIISTHNPSLISSTLKKAVEAGIVVIIVNSDVPQFETDIHAVVGYNQRLATAKMGKYLIKISDGKNYNIGVIEGSPGYHSTQRVTGFIETIEQTDNLKVVSSGNGGWNIEGGYNVAVKMLKNNPQIDVIFAANDYEILGAISAAKTLNRDDIIFLGNDGDSAALYKISTGELNATVNTAPINMGITAIQVGIDILSGKSQGGFVETPSFISNNILFSGPNKKPELKSDKIVLYSEEQSGIFLDILNEIYSSHGIHIEQKLVPFARGLSSLKNGTGYGILIGGFPGVIENVYFPQWHYNTDTISALYKIGDINFLDENSIRKRDAGIIRNYNIDRYLYTDIIYRELSSRESAFKMLQFGRIDLFIDVKSETLKALKIQNIEYDFELLDILNIRKYFCFANNKIGYKLAEIFDDDFPILIYNGKLKKIFEKWNKPYPF